MKRKLILLLCACMLLLTACASHSSVKPSLSNDDLSQENSSNQEFQSNEQASTSQESKDEVDTVSYGEIPISDDGYIYVDGNPFDPYEFTEDAMEIMDKVHLNSNVEFVDARENVSMETTILFNEWLACQTNPNSSSYTEYVLLTAFCAIVGIDDTEYEESLEMINFSSDPDSYESNTNSKIDPGTARFSAELAADKYLIALQSEGVIADFKRGFPYTEESDRIITITIPLKIWYGEAMGTNDDEWTATAIYDSTTGECISFNII